MMPSSPTNPELHLSILPAPQRALWSVLQEHAADLDAQGLYLAGGTALALQIGHRQSLDFDFFSRKPDIADAAEAWLSQIPGFTARDRDAHTLHADVAGVKLSVIGKYRYPLLEASVHADGLALAGIRDIGVMKLLALSHRAAVRDYIDIAAILRSGEQLSALLDASQRVYGTSFNPMIPLRALSAFDDLEGEMPAMLDAQLASSWQDIIRSAVRSLAHSAR